MITADEIGLDGAHYRAHRLAWLYAHGVWPEEQLDHRDLARAHNAIGNLREATNAQNNSNQPRRANNTSGFKGVSFCKQTGRWVAQIRHEGHKVHLGRYESPEHAFEMYCLVADMIQGEFANYGA